MSEHLVHLHLVEQGTRDREALFAVSLLLDDRTRHSLAEGDRDGWRETVGRARALITDHVAERRGAEGLA